MKTIKQGINCYVADSAAIEENVVLGHNVIIEENVTIGNNVFIDSNSIIRRGSTIDSGSTIASNCIIGEYLMDFYTDRGYHEHFLHIGRNALIRSGSIIYSDSEIGDNFQTGHQVTIREKSHIGNHVSIGTLSDIQGNCQIGNYVRMHSNVHIGQLSTIEDYVWIFPYVVLTNDPTPPSDELLGVYICSFAVIATNSILLPGIKVHSDSLIGAGAIVTKDVEEFAVVVGNPAKKMGDVRNIKNKVTGENAYPWKERFSREMPWNDKGYQQWYQSLNVPENY